MGGPGSSKTPDWAAASVALGGQLRYRDAMRKAPFSVAVIALTLCLSSPAQADEERTPTAHVTAADYGRYFFAMIPDPSGQFDHAKGSGICYEVRQDGSFVERWRTAGWYAFSVYLSFNGRHLVRIGNWPRGHAPSKDHLAIAFYDGGKQLATYSTLDVIRDPSRVQPSVSHYSFRKRVIGFDTTGTRFAIEMIDGVTWTFDVTTGRVVAPTP